MTNISGIRNKQKGEGNEMAKKSSKKSKRVLQENLDCPDNGTAEWALMRLMWLASQVTPTEKAEK